MREIFEGLGVMYMLSVVAMIAVIFAMAVDFVSGWRKAKMRGDEHTSYAASRTLTKFLIYEGILIIGVCIDTMIHFAWDMFMEGSYYVPLMTIGWGIILCVVEAWSVKEKADKKARKRMDEAATALAKVLDKETVLELLRAQMKDRDSVLEEKKERKGNGGKAATRTILDKDDN